MRYFLNGTLLKYDPEGWQDDELSIVRTDKGGFIIDVSPELKYIRDGKSIIDYAYNNSGVNAVVELIIERYDKLINEWKQIFKGNLDFTTYSSNNNSVQITANSGSISNILNSKETQEYAIECLTDVTLNDCISGGVVIAEWYGTEQDLSIVDTIGDENGMMCKWKNVSGNYYMYRDIKMDLESFENKISRQIVDVIDVTLLNNLSKRVLNFVNTLSLTKNISGNVQLSEFDGQLVIYTYNPALDKRYWVKLWVGVRDYVTTMLDTSRAVLLGEFTGEFETVPILGYGLGEFSGVSVNANFSFDVEFGDGIGLFAQVYTYESSYWADFSTFLNLANLTAVTKINVTSELPNFDTKSLSAYTLFEKLAENLVITNVKSTFLNTLGAYFTCGDALRGLTNPKLKTSMAEFFNTINNIYGASLGIEYIGGVEYLSLEDKYYFYDASKIYHLGKAKELEITPIEHITSVDVGYEPQNYEDIIGREEFNSTQNWSIPLNIKENKDNRISKIRADGTGIVNAYVEGALVTETEDKTTDNDTFILDIKDGELNRDYEVISGVKWVDNVFNVNFSPKRCLLRNGAELKSYLYQNEGDIIQTSFDKNVELISKTADGSTIISEKENISFNSLENSVFLPKYYNVTMAQPIDINIAILQGKQNGVLSFEFNGILYYGFLDEININVQRKEINIKLIAKA